MGSGALIAPVPIFVLHVIPSLAIAAGSILLALATLAAAVALAGEMF